ncbi:hypothetical protein [Pseudomonas sp. 37 R 15]|uniref:Uncharacterized protein n=1 Tax=Pseudomonas fluorescens TaxID=294 RepID=A0A2N1E941_PSEFL|nr:hypothetical protein CIB54_08570 [Pseudomonas fluorescens]TKK30857.1 hypothetical protein PspCFBP13528_13950 [Pseudomonas sp. CFBP13528]CRM63535.1 hypothetical protein [Pseudomonas sp. 37 R 15]
MTRAINKNKKPEINNKNRARNYFWGSFGSPCSFRQIAPGLALKRFWRNARSLFLHHPLTKC